MKSSPAVQVLSRANVEFALHEYAYDTDAAKIGIQAAVALGIPPGQLLKTLIAQVERKPVCVVIPDDRELSLKRLAAAVGGKAASMMSPDDAERLTGYVIGGISPLGQRRRLPTVLEGAALEQPRIFVNAGRRGLQVALSPQTLVDLSDALVASVARSIG